MKLGIQPCEQSSSAANVRNGWSADIRSWQFAWLRKLSHCPSEVIATTLPTLRKLASVIIDVMHFRPSLGRFVGGILTFVRCCGQGESASSFVACGPGPSGDPSVVMSDRTEPWCSAGPILITAVASCRFFTRKGRLLTLVHSRIQCQRGAPHSMPITQGDPIHD